MEKGYEELNRLMLSSLILTHNLTSKEPVCLFSPYVSNR